MSYFAAPVAIISIAQQARPNVSGHTELARVALMTSSTRFMNTMFFVSGSGLRFSSVIDRSPSRRRFDAPSRERWLLRLAGLSSLPPRRAHRLRLARNRLHPVEIPLAPTVDESDEEDREEDQHLREHEEAEARLAQRLEDERPRIEESDLDVEDEKDERERVEADVEADPRAADRGLATLVALSLGRLALRVTNARPQESPDHRHRDDDEEDPEEREREEREELVVHDLAFAEFPAQTRRGVPTRGTRRTRTGA